MTTSSLLVHALLGATLALALPGKDARAQVLFAADGQAGNPSCVLMTVNPATGAQTSVIGPIGYDVVCMAFHPVTGVLYGSTSQRSAVAANRLITINITTGAGSVVGQHIGRMAGLTFDASGQLYGWSENGDDLYRISTATGAASQVGDSGLNTAGSGICFDSGGTLWVASRNFAGEMHSVSTVTGMPLSSRSVTGPMFRTKGLTLNSSGVMYGVQKDTAGAGTGRNLITMDTVTGVMSPIGALPARVDALAFQNVMVAPSCAINAPLAGATVSGEVDVNFDGNDPQTAPVSFTFTWSTDSGATWGSATAAGSSPLPNPTLPLPTPASALHFFWDSPADGVGAMTIDAALLRITVSDGTYNSTCTVALMVDNVPPSPTCAICGDCNLNTLGPDVLDALTAAQIAVGLSLASPIQALCCDVNSSLSIDIVDALLIAQSGAGLGVVLTCP